MWVLISGFALLCCLLELADGVVIDKDLEQLFKDRTKPDWEDVWHKERHVRCRETLLRHLYWACEKDIYRLTRRSDKEFEFTSEEIKDIEYPWIPEEKALEIVRTRRSSNRIPGSSITNECCSSTGCTWEEYAEYCPTNKRYTSYI